MKVQTKQRKAIMNMLKQVYDKEFALEKVGNILDYSSFSRKTELSRALMRVKKTVSMK